MNAMRLVLVTLLGACGGTADEGGPGGGRPTDGGVASADAPRGSGDPEDPTGTRCNRPAPDGGCYLLTPDDPCRWDPARPVDCAAAMLACGAAKGSWKFDETKKRAVAEDICWYLCTPAEGETVPDGGSFGSRPLPPGGASESCDRTCVDGVAFGPAQVFAFPCEACRRIDEHSLGPRRSCGLPEKLDAGVKPCPDGGAPCPKGAR